MSTSITSYGVVESEPSQTYGSGETIIRIGNGGAGATGLIEVLANDYLSIRSTPGSIEWVCNHSRNTQLALLHGHIDLALTYERDQEALAASEGWSKTAGCAFHDHFCIVGPIEDPAGLKSTRSLQEAFSRIWEKQTLFHSRADDSATMWKERKIWAMADRAPWDDVTAAKWYKTSQHGPGDALIQADRAGAYLLSDRSTLLRQTSLGTIHNSTIFFEPSSPHDILMNSCYALVSPNASETVSRDVELFLEYMWSPRGQQVISTFGESVTGFPFFAKVEDGFARSALVGGRPSQHRWVVD